MSGRTHIPRPGREGFRLKSLLLPQPRTCQAYIVSIIELTGSGRVSVPLVQRRRTVRRRSTDQTRVDKLRTLSDRRRLLARLNA